jgi:S1-C subfamily serine protease
MLKVIKSLFSSLILAGAIIYGAVITPELHNHYLRWNVGESVVKVVSPQTDESGGTGFAVKGASGEDYIMTNRHVCGVGTAGLVKIKFHDGTFLYKRIKHIDKVHDLCLIEGVKGLKPLDIGKDLGVGEFLYVVGHPALRPLTVSSGEYIGREDIELAAEVETREACSGRVLELPPIYRFIYGVEFLCLLKYESMVTTAVIYGGNSGSPVVNRWGQLIGVAFAGNVEQEHNNYIKLFLNKF